MLVCFDLSLISSALPPAGQRSGANCVVLAGLNKNGRETSREGSSPRGPGVTPPEALNVGPVGSVGPHDSGAAGFAAAPLQRRSPALASQIFDSEPHGRGRLETGVLVRRV